MPFTFDHDAIIAFVQANQHLAPLVVFLMGMGETIVIVSIFIPSTFLLFAVGGLLAAAGVPLMPSLIAGALGSAIGYAMMYLVSAQMEGRILRAWPSRTYPEMMERAQVFSRRWGAWAVLLGHFSGPLRVLVPVVAGVARMAPVPFMLANLVGAVGWIVVFFAPGYLIVSSEWFRLAVANAKSLF